MADPSTGSGQDQDRFGIPQAELGEAHPSTGSGHASAGPPKPKRPTKPKVIKPLLTESVQMYRTKLLMRKGPRFIERGDLTDLRWLDEAGKQRLIDNGAVREVMSPPLAELAGWQTRAKKLIPLGILTMADFLFVPAADLAPALRVKAKTVLGWQDQLREWSKMTEPPRR